MSSGSAIGPISIIYSYEYGNQGLSADRNQVSRFGSARTLAAAKRPRRVGNPRGSGLARIADQRSAASTGLSILAAEIGRESDAVSRRSRSDRDSYAAARRHAGRRI